MISKWRLYLKLLLEKLWVVALLYAMLAVLTTVAARFLGPWLPESLGETLGAGSTEAVLTILASSMLSVVTFSLGIMVSAFSGAAASVSPRAIAVLKTDRTTQRVLATFLGAFVYSLIGIIAIKGGLYSANSRLVLFIVTVVLVLIIVITMLRWINHLTVFGLMTDSIDKVEVATEKALTARIDNPFLGGHGHFLPPPPEAKPITQPKIGYIRYVHMDGLQDTAEEIGAQIYLAALPGSFVHPGKVVAYVLGPEMPKDEQIHDAFSVGDTRSYEQDPRFGITVLSEIAERALSPAVNDPGTAIDVLGRSVRLLALLGNEHGHELRFPRVWVPPLSLTDMFNDIFPAIARDGAATFSVQIRLQKCLLALAQIAPHRFGKLAQAQSEEALGRCKDRLIVSEVAAVASVAAQIADVAQPRVKSPI
ncbi:DUF2254 domain-containing protein [Pseudorhodobacter sp.]|uniref:DUF2254 domain-containing protein n=1 Tax=Pseudorhodobacter sp. TaxID=1934400 RepID=UPI002647CAE4|nr:DUF2254 domain-containing protein [Pseudorhodobacter sp.]MDN5785973.1 DUF2254 domain-containing protein [Pseudorhodobacter sp.]